MRKHVKLEVLGMFKVYLVEIILSVMVWFALTVPSMPPSITDGFNISSTGLSIEWSHIPLDFIHGNLLGYIILYKMSSEPDSMSVPIDTGPDELSKNITELLMYTEYCVRMAGKTRIGTGNWSDCLNITTDEDGEETVNKQNKL